MGQAASKAAAVKTTTTKATQAATATAAKAAAPAAIEANAKVISTPLTRDQIEKRSAKAAAVNASASGADSHDHWRAAPQEKPVELMEMNEDLLEQMKKFEDYDRVEELPVRRTQEALRHQRVLTLWCTGQHADVQGHSQQPPTASCRAHSHALQPHGGRGQRHVR